MVFSSLLFLFVFLGIVLLIYYILPRRFRNLWLFVASLFFYGYGEPVYLLLFVGSITINYISGLLLEKWNIPKKRKAVLVGCVVANLGLLAYFKYTMLILGTLKAIPVFAFLPNPEITLPIGISFYTFQAMSYVIDVYRGNCKTQKNYITFGTYVALFPQLIAGPIVRYVDVEYELQNRKETPELFQNGVKLFVVGLAKKVLLANAMGQLWGYYKAAGASAGVLGCWVGVLAFTLQIYFDFSGYSDMARGLGNFFGFHFVKNFDYPYISKSITEFWRRWHISLGTWFREYVYIPLGGNRKGKLRQCPNLFIVWALTGLWHGASWNFAVWGLYFGVILTLEKFFLLKGLKKAGNVVSHIYALLLVMLGWVIFDFTDTGSMFAYFRGLFSLRNGLISSEAAYWAKAFLPLLIVSVVACLPFGRMLYEKVTVMRYGWIAESLLVLLVMILCTAALVSSTYNPFIYFRF